MASFLIVFNYCISIVVKVKFFAWGKLADACGANGRKGRGVRVVGRLRQDRWDGADGKTHTRVVIVAEHVEFRPQSQSKAGAEGSPESESCGEAPELEACTA
jgi:single-strand DNA-binding protein